MTDSCVCTMLLCGAIDEQLTELKVVIRIVIIYWRGFMLHFQRKCKCSGVYTHIHNARTLLCAHVYARTHTHNINKGGQMLIKRIYKGVRLWKCLDHGGFCYLVLQLWLLLHSACQVLCKLWLFLLFVHRVLLHSLCSVVQDVIVSAVCPYSVFINAALSTGCRAGHDCFCCLFWLLLILSAMLCSPWLFLLSVLIVAAFCL